MSTIEVGSEREVMDSLKEIPSVNEVHQIYGVYDLIIYIEAETLQELKDVIIKRIRKIDKIKSALPMICIKEKNYARAVDP